MDRPAGYNPLRWDCNARGKCYNDIFRPKIENFSECFFGKIAMSDIDAAVEVNGNFLFVEWKSNGGALTVGQRIFFERLTRNPGIFVYVVRGDAETMRIDGYNVISGGVMDDRFIPCDLDGFKALLKEFNDWAIRNPQK